MRYFPKAFLRSRDRPLLIWLAPPILLFAALSGIAFWTLAITSHINDPLSNDHRASLFVATICLLGGAMVDLLAAFGFITQRAWARPVLTLGSFAVLGVALLATTMIPHSDTGFRIDAGLSSIVFLTALFWYFYGHKPVREYYDRLGRSKTSSSELS